jgi:hypothetical protein
MNDLKHRMDPIGFLDDNKQCPGRMIHGKEVFGKQSHLPKLEPKKDQALIQLS